MPFRNYSLTKNGQMTIGQIFSPNFVHNVSGWQISKDGNAEFNQVQARGEFFLNGNSGSQIAILLNGGVPAIVFLPPSVVHNTSNPDMFSFADFAGAVNEVMVMTMSSGKENGLADTGLQLFSESADASVPARMVVEFGGAIEMTVQSGNTALAGAVQPGNGTTSGVHIYSGTGAPGISGVSGDLYVRKDWSAGSYLYVCNGGASWTAFA